MEESDREIKKSTYSYEKRNVCNEREASEAGLLQLHCYKQLTMGLTETFLNTNLTLSFPGLKPFRAPWEAFYDKVPFNPLIKKPTLF